MTTSEPEHADLFWGLRGAGANFGVVTSQGLGDGAIGKLPEYGGEIAATSASSQMDVFRHGGTVARVPDEATACSHRGTANLAHPIAAWEDLTDTDRHFGWIRRCSAAVRPFTTGGVCLNLEADEGEDTVRANVSAEQCATLAALKATWDPQNLFRLNQTIKPHP